MFYNEFDKTVDYFYKCNNCGSKDVKLNDIDRLMKKDF